MDKKNTVLFDPGYAPIVIDSIGQIGYTYYMFNAVSNVRIKKINFPQVLKKVQCFLKTNVSFYLGCLLWASYIKKFDNYDIEGNKLLGENATEEEYTSEINFLIDFTKTQLIRDSKYYLGKPLKIDERYVPILEAYKEFLVLNKGFVDCSNTNQIMLPKSLKALDENGLTTAYNNIQEAIKNKDVESLLDNSYDLLF